MAQPGQHHRAISDRRSARSRCRRRGGAATPADPAADRGARQQSEGHHGRDPARHVLLRDRRVGRRQIDPDRRDPVQGAGEAAQQRARDAGAVRRRSRGSSFSTRSSTSTSRRSAARRAPTRRPIPAASRRSATGSPGCPRPRRAAICRGGSRSTSRAGAARPARATASSRSRCTSCPTSMSSATSARGGATTARRWRCCSAARASPTCST